MIADINAETLEVELSKTAMPVLVEIWAPWCGPCRAMAPTLEAIAQKFSGQARVVKVNADENPDLVRHYKVLGIPTLLYFSHGRLVDRQTGTASEEKISKRLAPLLSLSAEAAAEQEISGLFRWPSARAAWFVGAGLGLLLLGGVVWQWLF